MSESALDRARRDVLRAPSHEELKAAIARLEAAAKEDGARSHLAEGEWLHRKRVDAEVAAARLAGIERAMELLLAQNWLSPSACSSAWSAMEKERGRLRAEQEKAK